MKVYRPVLWLLLYYIIGFIMGLYKSGILLIPGTIMIMMWTLYMIYRYMGSQKVILLTAFLFLLFGMFRGRICFQEQRKGYTEAVEDCTLEGVVTTIKDTKYGITSVIQCKNWKVQARGIENREIEVGDRLCFTGTLEPLEIAENPGEQSWIIYNKNKGIEYTFDTNTVKILKKRESVFYWIQNRYCGMIYGMLEELLPLKEAGIAAAMLTGDRSEVDSDVQEIYRNSGIAHIIAISGMHIQILFSSMMKIGQRFCSKRKSAVLSLICIWIFGVLTGASVSTIRACIMLTVRNFAAIYYRSNDEISGLATAALFILLYRPLYVMDAGFQLSFGACYGLMKYSVVIRRLFVVPKWIRSVLSPSIAVTLATLPITLFHYYQWSPYSVFLNLLVVPLMDLVLIMLIVSVLIYMINPGLAVYSIGIVHFILGLYERAGEWVLSLPGSIMNTGKPNALFIILYFGLMEYLVWYYSKRPGCRKRNQAGLWVNGLFLSWFLTIHTTAITFLSVGQGDCAVITGRGYTYIIDCGPGYEEYLEPFLRSRGIHSIDGIFVSHMDSDHSEGIYELLQDPDMTVRNLYLPEHTIHEIEKKWDDVPTKISYWKAGDQLKNPGIRIDCIAPSMDKTYTDENEASMVLYIQFQNGKILMTGDMGIQAEKYLKGLYLKCDVLKLGHHGSDTSSSETFLEQVNPEAAWISCGENNSYGHPHKEVIERLERMKIMYCISYESGAMWLDAKGIHSYKETYRERWMG